MNIEVCNAALKNYCEKYNISDNEFKITQNRSDLVPMLELHSRRIPLLYWRRESKILSMKSVITDGTLAGISTGKIFRVSHKTGILECELLRELDIAQWLIDSPIYQVVKVTNGKSIDMIAYHENKVITTIEIALTLSEDAVVVSGHEIVTVEGIVTDKAIDAIIDQESVHLFSDSKNPLSFTDVSFILYGLDYSEVALVYFALDILCGKENIDSLVVNANKVADKIEAILKSDDFAKVTIGV